MTFVYSTPTRYVQALKNDNIRWPVMRNYNMFPYFRNHLIYWSGFFSSRPALKKQVKDYSSLFHSQSRLFALKMLEQKATDDEIKEALNQTYNSEDIMTIMTHHDAITGTASEYVVHDYAWQLANAFDQSKALYKKHIEDIILAQSNFKIKDGLQTCKTLTQNETVAQCPVSNNTDKSSFLVVLHNPSSSEFNRLVEVLLPGPNYVA